MKKIVSFLMIFIVFTYGKAYSATPSIIPPGCHIAAYGDPTSIGYSQFTNSAQEFHVNNNDITNISTVSRTTNQVFKAMLAYLNTIPVNETVLITDGDQSLFVATAPELFSAFTKLNSSFVISATRCRPSDPSVNYYPADEKTLSFVNAGSFVGKVVEMKKIVKRLIVLSGHRPTRTINQIFNLDYLRNRNEYTVDTHASVFFDLCGISSCNGDIFINCGRTDSTTPFIQVNLNEGHGNPKLIHSEGDNGGGGTLLNAIFESCFGGITPPPITPP